MVVPEQGLNTRNLTGKNMIPVRCFSCGKVISNYWDEYKRRVSDGEDAAAVLDDLGITRYCCRRMLLSHVELIDVFSPYQ